MAASTGTSFQKKSRSKIIQIPGCRPSLHNNQLLVSTGVPSLDSVIGGGLAVGTVLLVEEDTFGSYGRLLLKYFIAEGVMTGHSVTVSTADSHPDQMLKDLPSPIIEDPGHTSEPDLMSKTDDEAMKIAWRYKNMPKVQSSLTTTRFGHYYDLTKSMPQEMIDSINKYPLYIPGECNNMDKTGIFMNPCYEKLLVHLKRIIEQNGFNTASSKQDRSILRIAIHSLGSPLWGTCSEPGAESMEHSLPRFLYGLRALLRTSYAACVITIPTHLFHDKALTRRVEKLCDTVVHLESFAGSDKETNPAYRDYHGLFKIVQLPRLNSLICHIPESWDLAFKLRRKKFSIEKLHLPPELSENVSRSQEDPVLAKPGNVSCTGGMTSKSKLDF